MSLLQRSVTEFFLDRTSDETIVAVAIKMQDGEMHALPRPARHGALFTGLQGDRTVLIALNLGEQGFITNTGQFVNRYQAHRIAYLARQTERVPRGDSELFSEDIW